MKVYLMMAEHQTVPGICVKVCATHALAVKEALVCANTMLEDAEMERVSNENDMNAAIELVQEEYGAEHCYVDITTHDLVEAN